MPTIIEARRRLFRFAGGAAVVLAVWFVGMAAAALVVTPSAVVAFGDPSRLVGVEGDLLASDRTVGTDTVKSLYSGGAWLVWPVLTAGCGRR
jgi:hypothetical protein